MILTSKQEEAIKIAIKRYRSGELYTVISGYAGSGKSTAIKYIVEGLGLDPENDVIYVAPTGRATRVLNEMGNSNTLTLHKLLYRYFPDHKTQTFRRKRNDHINYKLVIVDEIGMVENELVREMFSHPETHFICCGDPAQLPPVSKDADNGLLEHPHCFLDEIMRQNKDSEIIRLTMDIREGKELVPFKGEDVQVLRKGEFVDGMLTWASQVICATNRTRIALNKQMRELNGFHPERVGDGEKIIFLRNEWNVLSQQQEPYVNGTIGYLHNPVERQKSIVNRAGGGHIDTIESTVILDNGDKFTTLSLDKQELLTGQQTITDWKRISLINKVYNQKWYVEHNIKNPLPLQATSGYAISCHKAQGSTFDTVLVVEEKFPFDKLEHQRWLYTAATRPRNKLVIIKGE